MKPSKLTKMQERSVDINLPDGRFMVVTLRYDDHCGNGHNTFSITARVWRTLARAQRLPNDPDELGIMSAKLAKYAPQFAPYLKWHSCSSDGPMHYLENTVYQAGDKDHWGLRKGEVRQFRDKETGLPLWELDVGYAEVRGHIASAEKPAPRVVAYVPYGQVGEGKERDLDAARSCAIWPDATDEDLTAPGLEERLKARLPGLLKEFRKAMLELGFEW